MLSINVLASPAIHSRWRGGGGWKGEGWKGGGGAKNTMEQKIRDGPDQIYDHAHYDQNPFV